ncbi:MAG: ECF transporter S component [Clostridia bacterium]|nr:ECF transporter S component [Clostridia bacterium]
MPEEKTALRRGSAQWLAVTAVLTAMNIVLSMSIFSVPVPGGHLYFCDAIINTAAILLDPFAAFVVGGVGSFIGDMLFYPAPMLVSLITHGLQAVAVSALSRRIMKRRPAIGASVAVFIGALIMVAGYTLGRAYIYATPEYAVIKLPFEILQAVLGASVAVALCFPLRLREIFHHMVHNMR